MEMETWARSFERRLEESKVWLEEVTTKVTTCDKEMDKMNIEGWRRDEEHQLELKWKEMAIQARTGELAASKDDMVRVRTNWE